MTQDTESGAIAASHSGQLAVPTTRVAAFRWLAERHLDASYRLARAILRDDAASEDATHDAFVQAWRRWDDLRDHARFEQWFMRILVNTCRNRRRRDARSLVRDISTQIGVPTDEMARADEREQLRSALRLLSPEHRAVVALRYYRDLPLSEIASMIGVPVGTVHSRLHYALKHLATALAKGTITENGNER